MTEAELLANYPRLHHMAHDGAWPSIRDNGLLSAVALLDVYGVVGPERTKLLRERRPESVRLKADGLPGAVLRDQKPMSDASLVGCLQDGMSPADWYELLNSRSFFWLSIERVKRLIGGRAYRGSPQTLITLDTAGVLDAHRDNVWLSPMNTGFTMMKALPRGLHTFKRIADFPFAARSTRARADNVVEFVVDHSVPDLADHVLAVQRVHGDQVMNDIWRRAGAEGEGL